VARSAVHQLAGLALADGSVLIDAKLCWRGMLDRGLARHLMRLCEMRDRTFENQRYRISPRRLKNTARSRAFSWLLLCFVVKQAVEHVRCIAHIGVNDLGMKSRRNDLRYGYKRARRLGPVSKVDLATLLARTSRAKPLRFKAPPWPPRPPCDDSFWISDPALIKRFKMWLLSDEY
jgi:hypothetical protein